jgi:hypothetical protein
MAVLVIHDCAYGHQQQNLKNHGGGATQSTSQRSFQRAFEIKLPGKDTISPAQIDCSTKRHSRSHHPRQSIP